jgi:cysteine desulfurase
MPRIYMDANATTPVLPDALRAMEPHWNARFGNASAVHAFGRDARDAVDAARDQVAALIGGKPAEVTFTSGGTESDNLALFGVLNAGDHLVISAIEHDAVLHAADAIEKQGVTVTRVLPDSDGVIQPEAIAAAMQPNTRLVSVMTANN